MYNVHDALQHVIQFELTATIVYVYSNTLLIHNKMFKSFIINYNILSDFCDVNSAQIV